MENTESYFKIESLYWGSTSIYERLQSTIGI